MRRLLILISSFALAVGVLLIPARASAPTTVRFVSPVTAAGKLRAGYHVDKRMYHADCIPNGAEEAAYADRCFVGNGVYDPCFSTFTHNRWVGAYCVFTPWQRSAIRLFGTEEKASTYGHGTSLWGLSLQSGRRCIFEGGMSDFYRGRRLNFFCSDHLWLVGRPNKTHPAWTMLAVTWTGNSKTNPRTVAIARAFYSKVFARP